MNTTTKTNLESYTTTATDLYESLGLTDLQPEEFARAHVSLVDDFSLMRRRAIAAGIDPQIAYEAWIELRKQNQPILPSEVENIQTTPVELKTELDQDPTSLYKIDLDSTYYLDPVSLTLLSKTKKPLKPLLDKTTTAYVAYGADGGTDLMSILRTWNITYEGRRQVLSLRQLVEIFEKQQGLVYGTLRHVHAPRVVNLVM